MIGYTLKRLGQMLITLLIVSLLIFIMIRAIPGDPARVMLGDSASEEKVDALRIELGLDEPVLTQYVRWMQKALTGDLGTSIIYRRPVADIIGDRIECTLLLGSMATILVIVLSVPLGIITAVKANKWQDQVFSSIAQFLAAVPTSWLGLVLMLLFAIIIPILPTSGFPSVFKSGELSNLKYLVLPSIALALPNTALIIRMIRSSMLDVTTEDYVRTARAKGLSNTAVYLKHVFRDSLISVVSSFGVIFAALISGSVVTESVFALPGLGRLLTESILLRDYPTVQGVTLLLSVIFMVVNLIVDISYAKIDPRICYSD